MTMRVGTLVSELRQQSRSVTVNLGDVELYAEGDRAGTFRVGEEETQWNDRTAQLFLQHVKGPGYKYVTREDLGWQRQVVQHHTRKHADNPALVYFTGHHIEGIYSPEAKILPLGAVAERMARVFDADDVADVRYAPDQVEMRIVSKARTVTVPGIEGHPDRPLEGRVLDWDEIPVGDMSAGGVQLIMHPGKPERAPSVRPLWVRKVCENGMTIEVPGSLVGLRGRTVEEILDELENQARLIFGSLEEQGQRILHSAQTPVPGTITDFIRGVARDRGINAATTLRLQEMAAILPADSTVYDVTQLFTGLAQQDGVPVTTRRSLEAAGGDMSLDTERMVHRCITCERPLTV